MFNHEIIILFLQAQWGWLSRENVIRLLVSSINKILDIKIFWHLFVNKTHNNQMVSQQTFTCTFTCSTIEILE